MPLLEEREFEALVEEALADLPDEILQHMDNVAVVVADWPSPIQLEKAHVPQSAQLFGLYEGVPLTQRGVHYNLVPPDRITIFRGPLQVSFGLRAALRNQIRRTVVHEIAHHFGIGEQRIRELGY